jgi:8-oxo-dGTP pyrophosphatase MutT (NUDIX family)
VDDAVDAAQSALAAIRAMPGSQERVNEAGRLARELRTIANEATSILREEAWRIKDEEGLTLAPLAKKLGVSRTRAHEFLQSRPDEPAPGQEPSTVPEPQPVVAAVVSSHLGVLVGRRRDGRPEWTFIAGEIEPGESPADAAVREVKEETGLEIHAGRIIGRRVHPATGRSMVYMAGWPVRGTEVIIGDEDELAEVRWASLAELRKLMGDGIFEPVMKHLKRTLEG